jgi:hypothetical protein
MELSRHAIDKLETYGISAERLTSWREDLQHATRHRDRDIAATILVSQWEGRRWITVLSQDGKRSSRHTPQIPAH